MKIIEPKKFRLSKHETLMEGWPDLIKTQSGKLICVFNQCVGHGNRNHTRISYRTSIDNGAAWSDRQFIGVETQHKDQWNSIRISQLKNGRLIVVCDRIDVHERTDTTEMWMFESYDDGATWSDGVPLGIYGYCSDHVKELEDGTLLLLVSSFNSALGKSVVYAHRSNDSGKTWSGRINVAVDERYNLIEPAVLQMKDGTLVAFMRENSALSYNCMKAISRDNGITWEGIYEIPIPACHRPCVSYMSDGRILLTFRLYYNKINRITAGAIFDEATAVETEPDKQNTELYIIDYDYAEYPDGGYTAWTEYENGKFIMANYITCDSKTPFIRGYFFELSDFS